MAKYTVITYQSVSTYEQASVQSTEKPQIHIMQAITNHVNLCIPVRVKAAKQ